MIRMILTLIAALVFVGAMTAAGGGLLGALVGTLAAIGAMASITAIAERVAR